MKKTMREDGERRSLTKTPADAGGKLVRFAQLLATSADSLIRGFLALVLALVAIPLYAASSLCDPDNPGRPGHDDSQRRAGKGPDR